MRTIDCRNMACPMPVVTVKKAIEESPGEVFQVLLDSGAPVENVTRFAVSRGFTVEESPMGEGFAIMISGSGGKAVSLKGGRGETVMLVASDRLGEGPEDLGKLLMKNFIITLLEVPEVPDRMLFVNSGVKLATEGSEVVEALLMLGNRGVEVSSCGVCLDFFGLKDQLRAGNVTNMFAIAENLMKAGSVIRL